MHHLNLIRCLPALGAALLLAACGGEGGSTPAASTAVAVPGSIHENGDSSHSHAAAWSILPDPEQGPHAMAGFPNLGSTSHANAALKFLIHSVGAQRLARHLEDFMQRSDEMHRVAAQGFLQLIETSYSAQGPIPADAFSSFLDDLQKLPAFENFPIAGTPHDPSGMLQKLWQSFELQKLEASSIALRDDNNGLQPEAQYWTILKPASSDDSLQAIFDRTPAADWQLELRKGLQHLTVEIDNSVADSPAMHSTRNFDFNQTVRLQITHGNQTEILTLEPREVVAFHGTDDAGHYVAHAKDEQWVRYDDEQADVLSQMPSFEDVRFINFAIRSVETRSESSSEAAPAVNWPVWRFKSNPIEQFPA